MIGLERILVPTDFSETSEVALNYGVALANRFGAGYIPGDCFQDAMERLEAKARHRIEELVPKEEIAPGRTVSAAVWGEAHEQVIKYAAEHHIDLIVCGTHGRRGWDHFVMGSVAERIVRTAPCPVLTVQHPEREFVRPETAADEASHVTV